MPLNFHPKPGTIVVCDFSVGFRVPEMIKRRPAIVVSPQMQGGRPGLCTIVPLSTEIPRYVTGYQIELPNLSLPKPYHEGPNWVKADMVFASSFSRLELIRAGKDQTGKRLYITECISKDDLNSVRKAILCSIGLSHLTKHLI